MTPREKLTETVGAAILLMTLPAIVAAVVSAFAVASGLADLSRNYPL